MAKLIPLTRPTGQERARIIARLERSLELSAMGRGVILHHKIVPAATNRQVKAAAKKLFDRLSRDRRVYLTQGTKAVR